MHDRPAPSAPTTRPSLQFWFLGRPATRYRVALTRKLRSGTSA
jgi:hypothetical protein